MRFVAMLMAAVLMNAADAGLLETGTFRYNTRMNGKDAGTSEISIRKSGANFIYTNHVTGQFKQQWEAIATAAFVPVSATLAFGEGASLSRAFELSYQDRRVTGFRFRPTKVAVDAEISADTVDQRIDWAAAISEELIAGREFRFHVYDPGLGSSLVVGRVVGPESVHVPVGTFEAMRVLYRIEKATGAEVYQVLTQRTGRRVLIKEEFPNGAVTELVEADVSGLR